MFRAEAGGLEKHLTPNTKITKAEADLELREIEFAARLLDISPAGIRYTVKITQEPDGIETIRLTSAREGHDGREARSEHTMRRWRTPLGQCDKANEFGGSESCDSPRALTEAQMEAFGVQWMQAAEMVGLRTCKTTFRYERDPADGCEIIHSTTVRLDVSTLELVYTQGRFKRCWPGGGYSAPLDPSEALVGAQINPGEVVGMWGSNL